MPFHVHLIGPYTFDALRGEIQHEMEELEIIARPAVDGSGIRRMGKRGRPFAIETWRYETNYAIAELVLEAYQLLIPANPQVIIKNSVIQRDVYQVLRVEKLVIAPCTTAVGTIVPNPQCLLVARWELLPMPVRSSVRET